MQYGLGSLCVVRRVLGGVVCLFVCAYDSRYACGGTATAGTTFLGRGPEYTRVTAEETRCRIATSPLVYHPSFGRPAHSLLGEVPLVTTLKCWFAGGY